MIRQVQIQVIQVCLIFLAACGSAVTSSTDLQPTIVSSQSFEITPTHIAGTVEEQVTLTPISIDQQTRVPTVTNSSITFYPVTPPANVSFLDSDRWLDTFPERLKYFDGRLHIQIKEIEPICHVVGKVFQIEVSFINVGQEAFVFNRKLDSGWGKPMFPLFNLTFGIVDQTGQIVHFSSENPGFVIGPAYSSNDFITLPLRGHYESVIDIAVPTEKTSKVGYVPMQSGGYYLTATYGNLVVGPTPNNNTSMSGQYDWNAWVGNVESNQIEICIQNL